MINISPSTRLKSITFSETDLNPIYQLYYSDTINNAYLRELRQVYKLDSLTERTDNEFEKIKAILDWTNKQWAHSGSNTPSKSDPLTILKEAKKGNNFRCVEYGIVSAAALNSIGIPSRVLALKTADVEKVKYGAGHVVAETYSKEFEKWIFIDGQFNAIPILNNIPLNAVEFQKAIKGNSVNIKIINSKGDISKAEKERYIAWISKYLFYYDITFDNRYIANKDKVKINEKSKLMLVPLNADNPSVFQRKNKIDDCLYTNNINDFYQKPN
ncbi:MAG: transglutaminase domain-containing protein [Bacteroidales bacterium]|nr:transglutaminase domain-containing protein [Bacteroidales bacterium]